MEHIVQFGISIDDTKIEEMVMKQASNECLSQINASVKEFTKYDYYHDSKLKEMFREEVKKVVAENKEDIIEQVVKQVSANLMKTKDIISAKAKLVSDLANIERN